MHKPRIFESRNDLIQRLRSEKTVAKAEEFFSQRVASVPEVVVSGVQGNTFRAFHNLPKRPSMIFREWAIQHIESTLPQLLQLNSHSAYSGYVHAATESLCFTWERESNSPLDYGRSAKLINLTLKKLACLQVLEDDFTRHFIQWQHVPLDSYTLVGLCRAAPELHVPRNATMKYIQHRERYLRFQQAISSIAEEAGVPAIYYDVLAWDASH